MEEFLCRVRNYLITHRVPALFVECLILDLLQES